jgi:aspartate aminotransferase-like enzyme
MVAQRPSLYRLRLPGPTTVPERVRNALAAPVLNHRGPEFRKIVEETVSRLQGVMGTSNEVMFFACSGTGMMEASLANVLAPGDKALFVLNGQFAERFAAIADGFGLKADAIEVPWGEVVSPEALATRLAEDDYRAVVVIHNESSTGVVADLAELGAIVRDTTALLIVDSVSGLGGIDMKQDLWGVDVLVSASQKAFMCPPGLGLVSVSEKAWKVIDADVRRTRFYWDFRKARDAAAIGQTAFTPPISLVVALREALQIEEELILVIEGEGVAEIDGEAHPMRPGTTLYLAPTCTHKFTNTGASALRFFWVLMPGGLSDFFRAIGRPRESGVVAPAPFARPDNVAEIEARTVFAKRPAVSQVS